MGRLVQIADGIVTAIYGQSVLNQVIGTDRQKIHLAQQAGHHQGCGWDFNHAANGNIRLEGHTAVGQLLFGQIQVRVALAQLA